MGSHAPFRNNFGGQIFPVDRDLKIRRFLPHEVDKCVHSFQDGLVRSLSGA